MSIWLSVLLFAVGLALVVKGGDFFVDAAGWMAEASGVPPLIVGATVVSFATTLPELLVSVTAAAQGKAEMAVGNAIGSVTANTGLIMALAMIFMTIICKRKEYLPQCLLMAGCSLVLWLACLGGNLQLWGSITLIAFFIFFMWNNVHQAKAQMEGNERKKVERKQLLLNMGKFIIGAGAIVGGSQLLVDAGSDIAAYLHVSQRVIAVTMVAIGTSLPELVTTITAIVKKQSGLSIGNIIGANIIDLALILPICDLVSAEKLPVPASSISLDMPVCLGLILLAIIPLLLRQRAFRWQGIVILAGYIAYLVIVV